MFEENKILELILRFARRLIPRPIFHFFQPIYHWSLSILGAVFYRFPSKSIKVIGVTGTKGKSTTVFMISKILDESGLPVAAIGSLGFKIKNKTWPNTLKMTMPGRLKMQKFLYEAKNAGCKYTVLEVTSEGLRQMRHIGVEFDCAVFTNLAHEHIESHGSFENYLKAKQKLFQNANNIQILNIEDPYVGEFKKFSSREKIFYGLKMGDITQETMKLNLKIKGEFNVFNALAALGVAKAYKLDMEKAKAVLESIDDIPGRMQFVLRHPFSVVVDYAHTPDSLELVYETLKPKHAEHKLICVLGAAGGGRDKWKRPVFGEIASHHCDEIILTNEDPYDENPEEILSEVRAGIPEKKFGDVKQIMDRHQAIRQALADAKTGDTVVITGKGSETSMALAGGKKIEWSEKRIVEEESAKLRRD